jgi:lysophospholipase L1-like esterase
MGKVITAIFVILFVFVMITGQFHFNKKIENQAQAARTSFEEHNNNKKTTEPQTKQPEEKEIWADKNWYAIGDSMTANNKYQDIVKNALQLKTVTTDAQPGQSMQTMGDHITPETLKDMDLITIFGGTNDYGASKRLGTINDGKETRSFYGHLKNVIEKVLAAKNPNAKVVMITPLVRGEYKNQPVYPKPNLAGNTLDKYVNAIIEVADSYDLPVINLFEESGITEENLAELTVDNLHPNDAGYEKISEVMIKHLKSLQ